MTNAGGWAYLLVDGEMDIGDGLFQNGRQSNRHGRMGKGVLLQRQKNSTKDG